MCLHFSSVSMFCVCLSVYVVYSSMPVRVCNLVSSSVLGHVCISRMC